MSARDWLYVRLVGALLDPERVSAELDAYRAEVLREAADRFAAFDRPTGARLLRRMADEVEKADT